MSGVEHTNSTDTLENKAVSSVLELFLFGVGILVLIFFLILECCSNVHCFLSLNKRKTFKSPKRMLKTGEI
jgi:hypothetical protein